ncbi:MAG: LamG domain-containing protein [Planctomycetaceae bacterium]
MKLSLQSRWCLLVIVCCSGAYSDDSLIAHWPLNGNGQDASGNGRHATVHNVTFADDDTGRAVGIFNGESSWLEVPVDEQLSFGTGNFTFTARVHTDAAMDDVPGDLLSHYDAAQKRGYHFSIKSNAGVTFSQANYRQLQFGIDDNQHATEWTDRGRPGNALLPFALCSFNGHLYAGTCEPDREERGHVYRWEAPDQWIDCGAPDASNSVVALAEFDGALYAGTGKYRVAGSSLPESENTTLGGRVFRYDGNRAWIDCGQLPGAEAVGGMVVFKGQLYASSLYRPASFFRYEGDQTWHDCGVPPRPADSPGDTTHMRIEAMGVFNGWLYATSYDGGRVFRFDGDKWFDCGALAENTQTYSFAVRTGRLYVGTWPSGRVYRMEAPGNWTDVGRLGEELEVMGMLNHNGRLVAGTLPLAEVYEYDGRTTWNKRTRLDHTPDVKYRRAWTMAEHAGQLFCGILPSGRVYSWRAGRVAMSDRALPSGWHHVAAVRDGTSLRIVLDGVEVAHETGFDPADFDLSVDEPLRIGVGPNDHFKGRISDVRLYSAALSSSQIRELAKP